MKHHRLFHWVSKEILNIVPLETHLNNLENDKTYYGFSLYKANKKLATCALTQVSVSLLAVCKSNKRERSPNAVLRLRNSSVSPTRFVQTAAFLWVSFPLNWLYAKPHLIQLLSSHLLLDWKIKGFYQLQAATCDWPIPTEIFLLWCHYKNRVGIYIKFFLLKSNTTKLCFSTAPTSAQITLKLILYTQTHNFKMPYSFQTFGNSWHQGDCRNEPNLAPNSIFCRPRPSPRTTN